MKHGDGVEQAIHCVALMTGLGPDQTISAADLAEFHGVSPSYLLKSLQRLSRAGILSTTSGRSGGYRLARAAASISLLDIVLAVEGSEPAFRCREIRQRGPNPLGPQHFDAPCGIASAMLRAERVYRQALAGTSIADLMAELSDPAIEKRCQAFLDTATPSSKPKGNQT